MSEFARQVVREEVAHTWLLPAAVVQKRREKLVRAILGGDVYCHFERRGGRLACAFSNEGKVLLAELVRDWLLELHGAKSFLWCEAIDGELALVLVVDGRIVKDVATLAAVASPEQEFGMALEQLPDGAPVFVHQDVPAAELANLPNKEMLATSVRERLRELRSRSRPVAELVLVDRLPGVQHWNTWTRWGRRVVAAGIALGVVVLAVDWWQNRQPGETADEIAAQGPTVTEAEYQALLEAPDPAQLLPAIHRAYRGLLADPLLGTSWTVDGLRWSRQEGALAVDLSLPVEESTGASVLSDELRTDVARYADSRGWALAWNADGTAPGRATVTIPVTAPPRQSARVPERPPAENPWHRVRLAKELTTIGSLRTFDPTRNSTFQSYLSALALRNAEWASPQLAEWLGTRLGGGPLVLESLVLVQTGPSATGELRFRSVYCAPNVDATACERAS